ncbi:hypothetical protein PsYK624_107990 [Phanerochaete sordida]|uniref:Uncharacterized protein n=1 Tax=Phanerochaete sordida TaxID=48140 RepID=A0A9P3GGR6_9APHY|nr:hypothetical protein PsYK624_107990 [Phanerochaete sordida]
MNALRFHAEFKKRVHEMRQQAHAERNKKKQADALRHEKAKKKTENAKARYEEAWQRLLAGTVDRELRFEDVPWPVFVVKGRGTALTADAIAKFLLPPPRPFGTAAATKERRIRLREALLRFHPDKFEGRFLRYVRQADQDRVREGVVEVTRGLNALLLQ